jgi:spore coat protein CotH
MKICEREDSGRTVTVSVEKISFIGLLLLSLLLAALLVYHREQLMQPASENVSPFVSGRVATIRIVMDRDDWQELKTDARTEQYVRADFWFDGELYKNVAVRPKGMSSLMSGRQSGRMPLKVDFNFFNFAQNFRGVKKLSLNNGFSDPTFIRETIGYELFEQMGLPTPRRAFADVWVNDIHLGLYTIVEQVDKTFLRRNFANPEGNLYKPETRAAALNWTKDDLGEEFTYVSQSSESMRNNLNIKIGGSRLGDLIKVLKREGVIGSRMLPDGDMMSSSEGPFPGGPGGPFPGGFPGDPNGPFARGMRGGFRGDPNGQSMGEPRDRFGGGPGGQFPQEPNRPFDWGMRRGFPGDPNGPFGRRGRGRFGGGPGGPFGRGGNLVEQMGLKTNENYSNHSALFHFLEVLNKCSDETFPSEIEKVLDVDQVLRFLAVSVMIVHLDNYIGMGHNYYLYEMDGRFTIIPWDLNMAFGTFGMGVGRGTNVTDFYIDQPTTGAFSERPLVSRLLAHKPYMDRYHEYLEQLLEGGFAEGVIETRIDELVEMIRLYVEADELKFFSTEDFEKNINEDLTPAEREEFFGAMGGMPEEFGAGPGRRRDRMGPGGGGGPGMRAPGLKSFIRQRRVSVREQLDGERPSRSEGGDDTGDFSMFERFRGDRGGPF